MSSVFLRSGTSFKVTTDAAMDLHSVLPPGNFLLKSTPEREIFVEKTEDFSLKFKLYGDIENQSRRILHTFESRDQSTGVMLAGEKGSGKTLLAKAVCDAGRSRGMPTLLVNAPYRGDEFNQFLQTITQPCIVLFDEFEKVYDKDQQQDILTLLDGVFPSKKLFMLTCNDKWAIDRHMRNRPGRIFYMLDFAGLSPGFIREYCEENLDETKYIEKIVQIAATFDAFNFDMLKALCEEMNRFKESPVEALSYLNIKAEFGGQITFQYKLFEDGEEVDRERLAETREEFVMNPFNGKPTLYLTPKTKKVKRSDPFSEDFRELIFTPADIVGIEDNGNRFIYDQKPYTLILMKKVEKLRFNYDSF